MATYIKFLAGDYGKEEYIYIKNKNQLRCSSKMFGAKELFLSSIASILLDDNRLKPLCRLYFNGKQWRVGLFDGENKDAKEDIEKLEDIIPFADRIRATALKYDNK